MKNRRYTYIGNDGFKTFQSLKQMKEWARDESHDGTYYISAPNITFTKTRQQVLDC